MKTLRTILFIGLIAAVFVVGAASLPTQAADHLDAPGLTSPGGDTRLDINDLYAFAKGHSTVFIMTVNPLAGILNDGSFHPDASYSFEVDNNGDAKADTSYRVTFEGSGSAQTILVRQVPGGGHSAVQGRGQVGENIALAGGGTMTAGVFDDPFFFDLNAFLGTNGRTFCDGQQADFFAGLNVSAIILEVPSGNLGGQNIGVWARTEFDGSQVDRMGRPAINTVFIPSDAKNAYNAGQPKHDQRDFSQYLGPLASVLLPDVLTYDSGSTAGFLNGRQLADDVIDIELQIITGNPAAGDCVDANDLSFPGAFPYLAPAH
jgi:hypothetical protein